MGQQRKHREKTQDAVLHSQRDEIGVIFCMALREDRCESIREELPDGAETFAMPENKILFRTICAMRDAGEPVDGLTLSAKLKSLGQLDEIGGDEYLTDVYHSEGHTEHWKYYCRQIKSLWIRRQKVLEAEETYRQATDLSIPTEEMEVQDRSLRNPEQRTELANARRFIEKFGGMVRYVATWLKFLVWRGTHWKIDDGNCEVELLAQKVVRELWEDVKNDQTKDNIEHAARSSTKRGLQAIPGIAKNEIAIDHSLLDADPWLLNCPNGTLDLRTGKLHKHDPNNYLTKMAGANYNPEAKCPRFLQFLGETLQSQAVVDFVQRFGGYALTGDVREQMLLVGYGVGSNGKSTLDNALLKVWGDYGGQAPSSLLLVKRGESHPTELTTLHGKRLVFVSETEAGGRWSESLVKHTTGGEPIVARRMREDNWSFIPTHKYVMATNHKPRIRGTDYGIKRRLVLLPFTRTFEGSAKDPTLPEKLAEEAEGILAWAVQGCLQWQAEGLKPPEEIRAATDEYLAENDILTRFIDSCCVIDGRARVKFSELYAEVVKFCEDGEDRTPSKTEVGTFLKSQGLKDMQSGCKWYLGIGLAQVGTVGTLVSENSHAGA